MNIITGNPIKKIIRDDENNMIKKRIPHIIVTPKINAEDFLVILMNVDP